MRKLDKISKIFISLCVIVLTYFGVLVIILFRKINMPVEIYTHQQANKVYQTLYQDYYDYDLTYIKCNADFKIEVKELIRIKLDIKHYIYIEKKLKSKNSGLCLPTIRTIVIDKQLSAYKYVLVLTHELMHLKTYSNQEDFVCFETFKWLYNSDNELLHKVGVKYALDQLNYKYSGEYLIFDYIINYLK
jgi:hypothetical protein